MRDERVREIAVTGILSGLIIVMTLVPFLGYITLFGIAAITLIHIPVLIGGIFGGRRTAFILATVFGLGSMFVALTRPAGPIDLVFQNPLVSVVPRMLFGLVIYYIYEFFVRLISNKYVATSVTMIVATFVHTLLVLVPLWLFGTSAFEEIGFQGNMLTLIFGVIITNGFMEMLLAGLIGGPIATRLRDALLEE